MTCWAIFYLEGRFCWTYFRIMSNPSQKAICSSRNKSQMAPNGKVLCHEKLGLRSNTWGKRLCFGRKSPVFEESMKERRSMYEHFPLCGSAWGAIWSRLLKKPFCTKHWFSENVTFFDLFWEWFWVFSKRCRWVCRDFGLEPRREMMRGGQLSFWRKSIN